MIRRLFGRKLRKSRSVDEDHSQRDSAPAAAANGGAHLTASQTFHGSRTQRADECRSYIDEATSSAAATSLRVNPELDRALMQTCTDVKYVRRRPKFTAVVDANFQRQCLTAHNAARERYGAPALLWSQELADLAKSWALKLADRGRILYPELPGINENIYLDVECTDDHLTTGAELVALWEAQAVHLDFDAPRWNIKCANFTQMVWRSSVELGVARFWNTAKNCLAVVAFYRPGGNTNVPGDFAANLARRTPVAAADASRPHDLHVTFRADAISQ